MKQTTMQFDKRSREAVTIHRLQQALDLMSAGKKATHALQSLNLTTHWAIFFEKTLIIRRINSCEIEVLKTIIDRKDYSKLLKLRSAARKKQRNKRKAVSFYEQKKDSHFIDVPNVQSNEPVKEKRSYNSRYTPRAKNAVALPWWKRVLLYLANH